jgi:hypothetical protein
MLIAALFAVLVACTPGAATLPATDTPLPATPSAPPATTPAPTPAPSSTATATATAKPQPPPDLDALIATVIAGLPPTITPATPGDYEPYPGIAGVSVLTLTVPPGSRPLWAVSSYGWPMLEPEMQRHFVAIFTHDTGGWQELGRAELACPDYVEDGSATQVDVEPARIWIEVQGFAGAHSGCYELLSFDGKTMSNELSHFADHPGAGEARDLDGDGADEVVLDDTYSYVFCYACGVRDVSYSVMRWDGAQLAGVELQPLAESAPAAVREPNNRAIALAKAGLWVDALAAIDEARAQDDQDPAVSWNAILIHLVGEARIEHGTNSGYPLLTNVLAGDYGAAVDVMREYTPAEIFDAQTPLVAGTNAEGWQDALVSTLVTSADQALAVRPDLAGAYFLRGWAHFLADPSDPAALADVERAAKLAPDDALLTGSAAYLHGH